jgi:hypothetical protein
MKCDKILDYLSLRLFQQSFKDVIQTMQPCLPKPFL